MKNKAESEVAHQGFSSEQFFSHFAYGIKNPWFLATKESLLTYLDLTLPGHASILTVERRKKIVRFQKAALDSFGVQIAEDKIAAMKSAAGIPNLSEDGKLLCFLMLESIIELSATIRFIESRCEFQLSELETIQYLIDFGWTILLYQND